MALDPSRTPILHFERQTVSVLIHYLHDLGVQLRSDAIEVKSLRSRATPEEREFLDGKLFAYYEVLSLIVNQARTFQVDPALIGLGGFDPDKELL